ncbi:MAG: ABC transporter permease subunit [Kiritimatiellae bacterium]|nr:ABC transporter permease subunit [Kiritimatiellia bacterium]
MEHLVYILRRILLIVPTFLGITLVCFALTRFLPGGPIELRLMRMKGIGAGGESAQTMQTSAQGVSETYRKELEAQFGFDKPFFVQYYNYLVVNKMGLMLPSYDHPEKTVWQLIKRRIPISVLFGLTSFFLTYLICIPLGVIKALKHRQFFDAASSLIVFASYAIPTFALGMMLKTLMPSSEESMFAPLACYVAGSFAMLSLLMKNSLLDQISSDYVRTVIAKGASRTRAIWMHAFRNAMIPLVTGLGSVFSLLFAGSIIVETIFEIPGMGRLSWDALIARDYAVFLGLLSLTAVFQLFGNLVSDVLYVVVDPRISFSSKS